MAKGLTFTLNISIDGAEPVPMEDLSPSERDRCYRAMAERLGRNMSDYYTQHPEEYARI